MSEAEKWEHSSNRLLQQLSFCGICGALPALVLFRSTAVRIMSACFGSGFGVGMSYVDARYVFGYTSPPPLIYSAEAAAAKKA